MEEIFNYGQLISVIKNYWNDINSPYTAEEIRGHIYNSYAEDVITGNQYDILEARLDEGFE